MQVAAVNTQLAVAADSTLVLNQGLQEIKPKNPTASWIYTILFFNAIVPVVRPSDWNSKNPGLNPG